MIWISLGFFSTISVFGFSSINFGKNNFNELETSISLNLWNPEDFFSSSTISFLIKGFISDPKFTSGWTSTILFSFNLVIGLLKDTWYCSPSFKSGNFSKLIFSPSAAAVLSKFLSNSNLSLTLTWRLGNWSVGGNCGGDRALF